MLLGARCTCGRGVQTKLPTRRSAITRLVATVALPLLPSPTHAKTSQRACHLFAAVDGHADLPSLKVSSGSIQIDELCKTELHSLNHQFGLSPVFGFYDDTMSPNALAIPPNKFDRTPDGLVLLGARLAREYYSRDVSGMSIVSIIAHEYGHILQFKRNYETNWGVRQELSADYLAGWYLAKTKAPELIKAVVVPLFGSLGDSDFTNEGHHGTPKQRSMKMLSGANLYDFDNRTVDGLAGSASAALTTSIR
jgi:hypothetical protein